MFTEEREGLLAHDLVTGKVVGVVLEVYVYHGLLHERHEGVWRQFVRMVVVVRIPLYFSLLAEREGCVAVPAHRLGWYVNELAATPGRCDQVLTRS